MSIDKFGINSYVEIKAAVRMGYSDEQINSMCPIGISKIQVYDLIDRAKQEIYVEINIFPSEAGKLLYDAIPENNRKVCSISNSDVSPDSNSIVATWTSRTPKRQE